MTGLDPVLEELFAITADGDPGWHHQFDPLDTDTGPLRLLLPREPEGVAEVDRSAASVTVSDVPGTPIDVGYPLEV